MIYAALRPDGCLTLVSFPYYTKYAKPGDSAEFYYLDYNP